MSCPSESRPPCAAACPPMSAAGTGVTRNLFPLFMSKRVSVSKHSSLLQGSRLEQLFLGGNHSKSKTLVKKYVIFPFVCIWKGKKKGGISHHFGAQVCKFWCYPTKIPKSAKPFVLQRSAKRNAASNCKALCMDFFAHFASYNSLEKFGEEQFVNAINRYV